MKASLVQHKSSGQSIPLIAVMLVFLFGMVALAVDVGQTYAEQRNIVRGTNAAALAGMNRYLAGGTDADVRRAIEQSLTANGVPVNSYGASPEAGLRNVNAEYLDAAGARVEGCSVVGACASSRVNGVKYIRVDVDGKVTTYFARLFGANELPVSSNAFSKLGYCTSGYYPIGVRYTVSGETALNEGGFVKHDGFYTDETYNDPPLKYKKLYLASPANPTGGFSLLRWSDEKQASGNRDDLATMLSGDGNIGDAFKEAAWPNITEGPAKPTGYPKQPDEFSGSEWVSGNYFGNGTPPFTGPVLAQLEYHKKNRTVMTLPLYRYEGFENGDTTKPVYYVETLGAFLLLDYGQDGNGSFLSLAYIRPGGQCASLESNPPASPTLTLAGPVSYIPRFRVPNNADRPIQFLVVLDTTGSMSWNFAGEGKVNGQTVSCVSGEVQCNSGPNTAWSNQNERRIYIAKQVLNDFVDSLGQQVNTRPNDVMRIVTFSGDFGDFINSDGTTGDNADAVSNLTGVYPATWTNNVTQLKTAITDAGKVNNNPYLTDGSTPSAVGLARATQVFDSAPKSAPDGQLYRRMVIFVTDGVANVLRNGMVNNYGGCSAETVSCQAGYIPGTNPPVAAPLEAMVIEGQNLFQSQVKPTGGSIYVVALGDIEKTGLSAVASSPNLVFPATDAGRLGQIFDDIQQDAVYGQCQASKGSETNKISSGNSAFGTPPDGFSQVPYPKVGEVTLTHSDGQKFVVPITATGPDGKLAYVAEDLPAGNYTMEAWLAYRAPEDHNARLYNLFVHTTPSGGQVPVGVSSREASLNGVVEYPFTLDMSTGVCPAASSSGG